MGGDELGQLTSSDIFVHEAEDVDKACRYTEYASQSPTGCDSSEILNSSVNGTNFLTKTIHSTTKVMGKYILTRPIPLIFWLNQLLLMRMLSKVLNLWCMW